MSHYELLKQRIKDSYEEYDEYYKLERTESDSILEYGENEFFWGKREAFEDLLEFIEKIENAEK